LLLGATVRSFVHMPLGISDRNSSLMITNIIKTLYEFNSKVERQFICFTDSVRCLHE